MRVTSMPQDADTTTLGGGVVDPQRQLVGGEPAEHHRVDGAEPRAGQHRHDGLGDHRHVDHHPVAGAHPQVAQHPGETGDLIEQLGVGEPLPVPVTGES